MAHRIVVLPTFDGDPGANFPTWNRAAPADADFHAQYEAAVRAILGVLDRAALGGRVTWFLNERDVGWSAHHAALVRELAARGYTVGLHTHFEGLFQSPTLDTEADILRACGEAKRRVEGLAGRPCVAHRSGCSLQRAYVYRALAKLGFRMLSDVAPGFCRKTAAGIHLDNSMVPRSAGPYRHGPEDWLNHRSQAGQFLHVPVTHGSLGALASLPDKVREDGATVVCWDLHPHEIQTPDGEIDPGRLNALARALARIDTELAPGYSSFDGLPDFLGACGARDARAMQHKDRKCGRGEQ